MHYLFSVYVHTEAALLLLPTQNGKSERERLKINRSSFAPLHGTLFTKV